MTPNQTKPQRSQELESLLLIAYRASIFFASFEFDSDFPPKNNLFWGAGLITTSCPTKLGLKKDDFRQFCEEDGQVIVTGHIISTSQGNYGMLVFNGIIGH